MAAATSAPNSFLLRNREKADFNQYWYSQPTIAEFAAEVQAHVGAGGRCAFLSTPSIFFSLDDEAVKAASVLFDFDGGLQRAAGAERFVCYDFNNLETLPAAMHHTFDMVVIDPPFITEEVWSKYADATRLLLKRDESGTIQGKVLGTTIGENAPFLERLLGLKPCVYQPSIPHLVYQYNVYVNYDSERMSKRNPEIPE